MDFTTERTPLVPDSDTHSAAEEIDHRRPNPLPRAQLANALLVNVCCSLSQLSILPFINQVNTNAEERLRYCVSLPLPVIFFFDDFRLLASWRLSGETSAKSGFTSDYWCALN